MRTVLAFGALLGCNAVFDLRDTLDVSGDRDVDGVADVDDNCPDAENAGQDDADGDQIGDACDGCPDANESAHDEDGDGRPDDCDPCPAAEDFFLDADADGIGDACDYVTATARVLFEPFVDFEGGWQSGAVAWQLLDDVVVPVASLDILDSGLRGLAPIVSGSAWRVTIGLVSTEKWTDVDRAGIRFHGADGQFAFGCELDCTAGCRLQVTGPSVTGAISYFMSVPTRSANLVAEAAPLDASTIEVYCSLGESYADANVPPSGPWSLALIGSQAIGISFVDAIR